MDVFNLWFECFIVFYIFFCWIYFIFFFSDTVHVIYQQNHRKEAWRQETLSFDVQTSAGWFFFVLRNLKFLCFMSFKLQFSTIFKFHYLLISILDTFFFGLFETKVENVKDNSFKMYLVIFFFISIIIVIIDYLFFFFSFSFLSTEISDIYIGYHFWMEQRCPPKKKKRKKERNRRKKERRKWKRKWKYNGMKQKE